MLIYLIHNKINGKEYVGQTIHSLGSRWARHLISARMGSTLPLHCAIRKYGEDNFTISILAKPLCEEDMDLGEISHIVSEDTLIPNGYNLHPGGSKHNIHPNTRAKLAAASAGNKYGLGNKSHLGLITSAETRNKISASKKGKKIPIETRLRMSQAKLGHRVSVEARRKMSMAKLGKPNPNYKLSCEGRRRIVEASTGNQNWKFRKNLVSGGYSHATVEE